MRPLSEITPHPFPALFHEPFFKFMLIRFQDAKDAWNQKETPVILRRRKQSGKNPKLRIRMPDGEDHFQLLKGKSKNNHNPIYFDNRNFWDLPYSRLDDLVQILATHFGKVLLMQPIRESQTCARACMEANGFECECSCLGAHHGSHNMDSSWYEVDDTYAISYGEEKVSLKVISLK